MNYKLNNQKIRTAFILQFFNNVKKPEPQLYKKSNLKDLTPAFLLRKNRGFTLVEVLVSIVIISILVLGIYSLIIYSYGITSDNKSYIEAVEIANQKMEEIRNLAYSDVGTEGGSPTGVIPDYEYDVRGRYTIYTTVQFYDDPYDGTLSLGTDDIFVDYKIATIQVSWNGHFGERETTFFSKIIPATEETLDGYGLLEITVVDADGAGFPNAEVHIENNELNPIMNADYVTDVSGLLSLPVLPGFENYEITVSKDGCGIDQTYSRTVENPMPSKVHLSVNEGLKTSQAFSIDFLSSLKIKTISQQLPDNWKINTDSSGESQTDPSITIGTDGYLYFVWEDNRSSSSYKVYAQKYDANGNQQWEPDDIIIATANNQVNPEIMIDVNYDLYVAWNDNSAGNQDVYFVKLSSEDGSNLLGGTKKIETQSQASDQANPHIALFNNGTTTLIMWEDDRNGDTDLYMRNYNENGLLIWPVEKRVNANPVLDGTNQFSGDLLIDSTDNIYIIWTDDRNTNFDIYAQKYDSNGNSLWISDTKINTDSTITDQYSPSIAIDSTNNIYIAWTDERDGDKNIYAQKYNSNGNSLWISDTKINTDSTITDQYSPSIAIDSTNNIYIAWTDERDGDKNIYAQKYNSNGNSLWVEDLRINIDLGSFEQYGVELIINPNTGQPFACWTDERNGDEDIFTSEFDYYEAPTYLSSIPIQVVGTKQIGDDPVIFEHNESYLSDANGEVNIILEWDMGYMVSLEDGYEDYEIIFTDLAQPFTILPAEGIEILLYLE